MKNPKGDNAMSKTRINLISLLLLTGLCHAVPVLAQESDPGLWDRLKGLVTQEGEQFQQILADQQQVDTHESALQAQLEQSRRMRAMHQEAVLLSALNIAWIYDELENWDCRVAEQKVYEVDSRLIDLNDFAQRLDSLCGDFGSDANNQRMVCEQQRSELFQSVNELENLRQRYTTACHIGNQQTEQIGGE